MYAALKLYLAPLIKSSIQLCSPKSHPLEDTLSTPVVFGYLFILIILLAALPFTQGEKSSV